MKRRKDVSKNTHEYFDEKNILVHEKKITARSRLRAPDFGLQGGFSLTASLQSGKFDSFDDDSVNSGQMFSGKYRECVI